MIDCEKDVKVVLASVTVVTGNELVKAEPLEPPNGKGEVWLGSALEGDEGGKGVGGIVVEGVVDGITLEEAIELVELDGLEPEATEVVLQSTLRAFRGRSRNIRSLASESIGNVVNLVVQGVYGKSDK